MVGRQNVDIADTLYLRDVAMPTSFLVFCIWGAHSRHLANTTEWSVCGGDAALCQITLTTCLHCVSSCLLAVCLFVCFYCLLFMYVLLCNACICHAINKRQLTYLLTWLVN